MQSIRKVLAFLNGIREFRRDCTTSYGDDFDRLYAYDLGRELAHRATFRRFEPLR